MARWLLRSIVSGLRWCLIRREDNEYCGGENDILSEPVWDKVPILGTGRVDGRMIAKKRITRIRRLLKKSEIQDF